MLRGQQRVRKSEKRRTKRGERKGKSEKRRVKREE